MNRIDERWELVRDTLRGAVSIAYDGCHKIYISLDEGAHQQKIEYGYDPLIRVDDSFTPAQALAQLKAWYAESCDLRFVSTVRTVKGDPNNGYVDLIPQFYEEDGFAEDEAEAEDE